MTPSQCPVASAFARRLWARPFPSRADFKFRSKIRPGRSWGGRPTMRQDPRGTTVYYGYHTLGNRTLLRHGETGAENLTYYIYNAANELNTLHDKDGWSYFYYDQNGNTVTEQTPAWTRYYDWDGRDMMVGVRSTEAGWTENMYRYDGLASRVCTVESAGFTYYDWDAINVIQEKGGAGNVTNRQVHGYAPIFSVGDIALMDKAGTPYVPLFDQVGTTSNLLDATGAKANSYTYDAFGVGRSVSESVAHLYRLSQRRLASDTKLYGPEQTPYMPGVGRFAKPAGGEAKSYIRAPSASAVPRPGGFVLPKHPTDIPDNVPWWRWSQSSCVWASPEQLGLAFCLLNLLGFGEEGVVRFAQGLAPSTQGRTAGNGVPVLLCEPSVKDAEHTGEHMEEPYEYVIISKDLAADPCKFAPALIQAMVHEWGHGYYGVSGFGDTPIFGRPPSGPHIRKAKEVWDATQRWGAVILGELTCCSVSGGKAVQVNVNAWTAALLACGQSCPICPSPYYPSTFTPRGLPPLWTWMTQQLSWLIFWRYRHRQGPTPLPLPVPPGLGDHFVPPTRHPQVEW